MLEDDDFKAWTKLCLVLQRPIYNFKHLNIVPHDNPFISNASWCCHSVVSVLASSVVDHVFVSRSGQTKCHQFGICNFFARAKTDCFGIRVICPIYLRPQTVVSVDKHYKNHKKCVDLVQSGHHRHDIAEKLLTWR